MPWIPPEAQRKACRTGNEVGLSAMCVPYLCHPIAE